MEKENIILFNKIKRIYHYKRKHSYLPGPSQPKRDLPTARHPSLIVNRDLDRPKLNLISRTPYHPKPKQKAIATNESRVRYNTEHTGTTFSNSMIIGDERYRVTGMLANQAVRLSIEPTKSRDRYDLSLKGQEAARLYSEVQGNHGVLCSFLQKRKGKVELVLEQSQDYDYEQVGENLIE